MALIFILALLTLSVLLPLLFLVLRPRPVTIPIKNRNVFITGGSSGIGLSLARRALAEGAARVSILALEDTTKLELVAKDIRQSAKTDMVVFSVDVRDFDAVKRAVLAAGSIDVLVCNHGVFMAQELEKQNEDEVKLMLDVNLLGTFHVIKAALPSMKINTKFRGPASIAIMCSMSGQMGVYGFAAYSASKFGLRGMAEALQQEVIEDDIHVSVICPPPTETPALAQDKKRKPVINRILTESTSTMTSDEVARISIDGIKRGAFLIPCNIDGFILSILTAGMSPQRSYPMAVLEVVIASIAHFVRFFHVWCYYRVIKRERAKMHPDGIKVEGNVIDS